MKPAHNRLILVLLPFALCGFVLAQPVYELLLQSPEFLVARQNTLADVWATVAVLSFIIPVLLALPAWLAWRRHPLFSSCWCWLVSSFFTVLFIAQLLQPWLAGYTLLFCLLAGLGAAIFGWLLLFTRWSLLVGVLAAIAVVFPLWFLLFSPVQWHSDNLVALEPTRGNTREALPDIVFLILDELPLATLLDNGRDVDEALFPGFARLQSMSNWYYNTTSVSDGTVDAVPAILTSHYSRVEASDLTVAAQPVNLFTLLGHNYRFNVAEAVTRLCPQSLCERAGPAGPVRFRALLLDLTAIYLHRVLPARWAGHLPDVSNNWSGFFAEPQVFFPQGWLKFAGEQTIIDRPAYFRRFIDSIQKQTQPTLNFMHILFPHEPHAYLPDGENYGLEWVRGQLQDHWGDVEWGLISGKQRHYLQTQYVDHLLNELLDRLQTQNMMEDTMIVVITDHGISFGANDARRSLSAHNAAAMLRVPLFIKFPGQRQARRIESAAMSIDVLPTLLAATGFSSESLALDGIDLRSAVVAKHRPRYANSYLQRKLQVLDETRLKIHALVMESRAQLKLDEPAHALWEIGPFDATRGKPLSKVCKRAMADVKVHFSAFHALPGTREEDTVHAYVAGYFGGADAPADSQPFLISNKGVIVASGYTWAFNDQPQFFALVEPKYVKQPGWSPRVWLLRGHECLG